MFIRYKIITYLSDRQFKNNLLHSALLSSMNLDFREHPAYSKLYPAPVPNVPPVFFPEKIARGDAAHLDALEAQSIFLIREAFHHFKKICMPWSMG